MATGDDKRMFPCPICAQAREVRTTKKNKPYLTCDPCGVQLFIRGPGGIAEFSRLLDRNADGRLIARLNEMEERYRLTCPKCGARFWAEPRLVKTSAFDGSLKGFRCPQKNCGGVVAWEEQ